MAAISPVPTRDLKLDFANGLDGMKNAIEEMTSDIKNCLDRTMQEAEVR